MDKLRKDWRQRLTAEQKAQVEEHARQCVKRQQQLWAKWRKALAKAEMEVEG